MRVIVTGGAGFIGSALVRHLVLDKGYDVLNVDALTYAGNLASLRVGRGQRRTTASCRPTSATAQRWTRPFANFGPTASCISRPKAMSTARSPARPTSSRPTSSAPSRCWKPRAHYWAALDGAAKDAFRFLHVSTDEVYGSLGDEGLFTEDTPYDPSSPYSASKASSDHLAKAWQRTYGLPVVVSNCSNNYGPYHFPEKLIPLTILNALAGERLPVYGKGENVRDWLYVEDHARALDLIAERGRIGETYNVGGRNERRNIDVVAPHLRGARPARARQTAACRS